MSFKRSAAVALLASVASLGACGDDVVDPGITIADFEGSWEAGQFTYTPTQEGTQFNPFGFVAAGGDLDVTITNTGAFSGILTLPPPMGGNQIPVAGSINLVDQETLTVDFDAQSEGFLAPLGIADFSADFTLTSNTFTWSVAETDFDFNFNGQEDLPEEEASLLVVLDRV